MAKVPRTMRVVFNPPFFKKHTEPNGHLKPIPEHQALWYYCILASSNWKRETDELVYEGEPDIVANYEQLFRNAAMMYNVDIDILANFWPIVDAELERYNATLEEGQKLTRLPARFRFYNVPIIIATDGKVH